MLQSIYTHAGCDYGCLYTYSPRHCFNPHTHAGCDNVHNVSGASFPVSIHTPTQGVTFLYICNVFRICFNPHTHAGCDDVTVYFSVSAKVSIHTPTQGVTQSITSTKLIKIVSIHTPTQGVTLYNLIERAAIAVSIHTPTQGVTSSGIAFLLTNPVSIHTPTQGVTLIGLSVNLLCTFQSTHPRRVWLLVRIQLHYFGSFNPHTHAGCDPDGAKILARKIVSIHTPTQGVTDNPKHGQLDVESFNPHTHAGCDNISP